VSGATRGKIQPKYHEAILGWQRRNFPELGVLLQNWPKYFGRIEPFELTAKVGTCRSEIEGGALAGRPKFERAGELQGNMFYTARDIIKAQTSTELGSIQQHRMSLETAPSEEARFDMLRIMAEELRHAYQMLWVLDHDPSWKRPGHGDVAEETIEALLAMDLGTHVLDAFNIPFDSFLDNVIYTMCIDLVGKYQLDMQKIFSYAPMARSMGPMFGEESFHLGSGRKYLKQIAVDAACGRGNYGIPDIQRCLNQWYPRGLEMFGNENGGQTAVTFGFKDKFNGEAQADYAREVERVILHTNVAIASALAPHLEGEAAKEAVERILTTRESFRGIAPESLILLPSRLFFRSRGPQEMIFQPYDLYGRLLTLQGKPISPHQYLEDLRQNLPEKYASGREFEKYRLKLIRFHQGIGDDPFGLR
jgi:1,2-phenylacetyl-CoA epoxidase catalytic subunit